MRNIVILGNTGSIGTQAIDVIKDDPDFHVVGLAAYGSIKLLRDQVKLLHPEAVCVYDKAKAEAFRTYGLPVRVLSGMDGLIELATMHSCEEVIVSVVGMIGIQPTIAALKAHKMVALANKETLVCAGHIIMPLAKAQGIEIKPIDSEHSAIWQSLNGECHNRIERILLTASGGPFRDWTAEKLADVTPEMALQHPNWSMGRKITIDSATMMNKGLEMIEAMWLFGVGIDKIQVLIHPQSVIHSGVEFADRSVLTQMGVPDMKIPISVALGYPDRLETKGETLDFFGAASELTFRRPNPRVFRCLDLAIQAARAGGSCPVVLNAANEVLVQAFLDRRIGFTDIADGIERMLNRHERVEEPELEEILEIDGETRRETESSIC